MRARAAWILAFVSSTACSNGTPSEPDGGSMSDAGATSDAGPIVISDADRKALATLSPSELPAPPPDVSNRFADDSAAASLGQKLFFDASFSGRLLDPDNTGDPSTLGTVGQTGRVSCSSGHLPSSGFVDTRSPGRSISLAAGWGVRRAPSLRDVGQAKLLMWGGRRDALYNQVFGVIKSPLEWNSARLYVAEELARRYRTDYEAIFGPMPAFDDATQFPQISADRAGCTPGHTIAPTCSGTTHGMPGDRAEYDGLTAADRDAVNRAVVNMGKAIGAYERRLSCGQGRFDAWMRGDATAMNDSEQRGALLFVGKGRCTDCHSGPFMSDQQFHDVGLVPVQVVFAAPADNGDQGAIADVAAAIADPLNTNGVYSDGTDGRLPSAATPAMQNAFRTPPLRCVSRRPSFMHTGQLSTLATVVAFFDRGGDVAPPGTLGTNELEALGLTADERLDLVHFLQTLDGPGPDASLLASP